MTFDDGGLGAAMLDYAQTAAIREAERRARRPWWWWVVYAAVMLGGFWVCWRTFAGWPIGHSLLQRLVTG